MITRACTASNVGVFMNEPRRSACIAAATDYTPISICSHLGLGRVLTVNVTTHSSLVHRCGIPLSAALTPDAYLKAHSHRGEDDSEHIRMLDSVSLCISQEALELGARAVVGQIWEIAGMSVSLEGG
jgi:hypothetical protein